MKLRARLEQLERTRTPTKPSVVVLTPEGWRDLHGRPCHSPFGKGTKFYAGFDPREL